MSTIGLKEGYVILIEGYGHDYIDYIWGCMESQMENYLGMTSKLDLILWAGGYRALNEELQYHSAIF